MGLNKFVLHYINGSISISFNFGIVVKLRTCALNNFSARNTLIYDMRTKLTMIK